ncbi:MAG TPA: hypothetical protein VG346_12910 [Acidimicrobiales bacterium]|jgi:hypothetical protein|nr:hypothetical protein [Acidimicrobiales bacterium]
MATQPRCGGARSWRTWLHELVHGMASDEWAEPATGARGADTSATNPGPQATLDELLRDASEARPPREGDGGAT